MSKAAYAFKLDKDLLHEVKDFCEAKGFKQGAFVERALREKMEQEELKEDIFDLITLRPQKKFARPFREYLKDRKK